MPLNLLTGSAQLSTTGNISGFVIFRHNNQEAVVPLESRNATRYIIAFDNTGGTATGVAINSVSAVPANVPVSDSRRDRRADRHRHPQHWLPTGTGFYAW